MKIHAIQTSIYRRDESIIKFILDHASDQITERSVLAITSKIISLSENQLVAGRDLDKENLIRSESDHYLGEIGYGCHLTIKHGLMIASAGIDESNSESGDYILYPKNPYESARKMGIEIKKRLGLNQLGILLTDSHTVPLRKGVIGTSLSHWGFRGVKDHVGEKDLFGRELKMTRVNVADALAVAATFVMGEGGERRPLAVIEADVEFTESQPQDFADEIKISPQEDLYAPIFRNLI